jgi:uncharacterized membrane protein
METLLTTEITISLSQILTVISLTTFALVFSYARLALVINYAFLVYCGYFSNSLLFSDGVLKLDSVTFPYLGFGLAILLLAMMGLVYSRE